MKKYKLIKDLPFMKKGTIYFKDVESKYVKDKTSYLPDITGMKHERFAIHSDWVENNPEFWEEIEEKDYEILTLKGNYNSHIHPIVNDEVLTPDGLKMAVWENTNVNYLLKKDRKAWQIHSIKRLSDGEIFTVGNKIVFLAGEPHLNHTSKIKSFELIQDTVYVHNTGCLMGSLKNIKHVKKPLFTTEDNYEIYDKEELVYLVNPKSCAVTRISFYTWDKTRLLFKTKEGLNEWMLWNKPLLSVQEVYDAGITIGGYRIIKEIAKNRI